MRNGAGKTTTMRMILGLDRPDAWAFTQRDAFVSGTACPDQDLNVLAGLRVPRPVREADGARHARCW
jgi:hypothetical protein